MNKYKISTIILSIITFILLILNISLIFISIKTISSDDGELDTSEDFNMNEYSYLNFEDPDNPIWQKNPILWGTDTNLISKDYRGTYFDYIDPYKGSETLFRSKNIIYGSPVYKDSKLIGFVGNDTTDKKSNYGVSITDLDGNQTNISPRYGDHEFYIKDNKLLYIGNGEESNDILYNDNYNLSNEFVTYNTREILGLPKSNTNTYQNNSDELHFNSFDIWNDELIINSRSFSTIFGIHMFENGKILSPEFVELDWVLPSDPTSVYFIGDDEEGDHPIEIIEGVVEKNPDFNPNIIDSYKSKIISPYINNELYDFENEDQAKDYHSNVSHTMKFFGEHKISVLNNLLKENNFLDIDYEDEIIYLSMHDNHWAGNKNNSFYPIWAEEPNDLIEDGYNSYTKILAVNITDEFVGGLPPKSYKVIFNFDNSTLSYNEMYSPYCSGSIFFSLKIDNEFHNYLSTNSGIEKATQLIEFDKINTQKNTFIHPKLVFENKWNTDEFNALYRSYPIFEDISDSYWGWNLMELNK